ncbi:MAG: hypothetical protein WCN87_03140 [Chlamydiota bacterium]
MWRPKVDENKKLVEQYLAVAKAHLKNEAEVSAAEEALLECDKVEHQDGTLCLEIGLLWQEMGQMMDNPQHIEKAIDCFSKGSSFLPTPFYALVASAKAYTLLGRFDGEDGYFNKAEDCFHSAKVFLSIVQTEQFHFTWQWAVTLLCASYASGEIEDWHAALAKFDEAGRLASKTEPLFLQQRGECLAAFGIHVNQKEYLLQAVHLFNAAMPLVEDNANLNYQLGSSYFHLFCLTYDRHYFEKALDYLQLAQEAPRLALQSGHLLAHLYLECGKIFDDSMLFTKALEQFEALEAAEVTTSSMFAGVCETLTRLALLEDRVDYLRLAKEKISRGLEFYPKESKLLYCQGGLMVAFGHYFSDSRYFEQAIIHLETVINNDKSNFLLWRALADAYFSHAEALQDPSLMKKAIISFDAALKLKMDFIPLWLDCATARLRYAEMADEQHVAIEAVEHFEKALMMLATAEPSECEQQLKMECMTRYGAVLDLLGDMTGENFYFEKAVEVLQKAHLSGETTLSARYQLALCLSHLGETTGEPASFLQAIEHFSYLAALEDEEAYYWTDWAVALLNLSQCPENEGHIDYWFDQAENKLRHASTLGDIQAYYYLACLFSLKKDCQSAILYLEKSKKFGALPMVDDLFHDHWLENVRETELFRRFIMGLKDPAVSD